MLLAAVALATQPCTQLSQAELMDLLAAGKYSYLTMDDEGFEVALVTARDSIACMDVVLEPETVIAFHLQETLAAFLVKDDEMVRGSLLAILAVEPSWTPPEEIAPAGHRLLEQLAIVQTMSDVRREAPHLERGFLYADGVKSEFMPSSRPWIMQVVDDQEVLESAYFYPGMNTPTPTEILRQIKRLDPVPAPIAVAKPLKEPKTGKRGIGLFAGALVAGAAAGGTYALAAYKEGQLSEVPCDSIAEESELINALSIASGAGAGVSLGLGVAGLVVAF